MDAQQQCNSISFKATNIFERHRTAAKSLIFNGSIGDSVVPDPPKQPATNWLDRLSDDIRWEFKV